MKFRNEWKWIVPIIAICALVFADSLGGALVYDDSRQIVRNTLIQDNSLMWKALTSDVWAFKGDGTQAASNYWRPTFTAWHIINFRLFGMNPLGWHVTNLLLHAGVCVLAYALLRRWAFSVIIAFSIARLGMLYTEQGRKDDARAALREYLNLTSSINARTTLENRNQAGKLLESLK